MLGRELREVRAEATALEKMAWRLTVARVALQEAIGLVVIPAYYVGLGFAVWYVAKLAKLID